MIFAMNGHPVDQATIVKRVYNQLVCWPSMNSLTIAQVLSSSWTDDNGVDFTASVQAAYDIQNGINLIDNRYMIDELENDRPLLFANTHHAMVVGQVDFVNASQGPIVQAVGVFDPFPGSLGFHGLNAEEMKPAHLGGKMTFAAAVHISDA